MDLLDCFPHLRESPWEVTSLATRSYNCIAWAAGDDTRRWWPDPQGFYYWPAAVRREETLEAFAEAFATLGYERCPDGDLSPDERFAKVVLYAVGSSPTHAARQLPSGEWTSKCGGLEDITHSIEALSGSDYGEPVVVLRRPVGL